MKTYFMRLVASMSLLFVVLAPAAAFAGTDPFEGVDCAGQPSNSVICQSRNETEDPVAGPNGVILQVTNIIAFIAGLTAVIIIVIGGIKYITAAGDASSISSAKNTILYAAVGLIVIALGRFVIGFVIGRI